MAILDIDAKNFISGESTTDEISDRGFSPSSYGLNLTKSRGVMNFNATATDRGSTTLTGAPVASGIDSDTTNDQYFVDDDSKFYLLSGATFTLKQTGANTYQLGTTDLINFSGTGSEKMYVTSRESIAQTSLDFASLEENWWSGLDTNFRHPMETVEGEMFIGNGNIIYFWNGTSSGTAFTLPTGVNVTSLRRHTDGRTLLAFASAKKNFSHTVPGNSYVYYCDPTIRDWTREISLEAQVEGTRVVGGVVYCTYGKNFGYFNGSGLELIKKIDNSGITYSHSMTNIDEILYVRDGIYVLGYGNIGAGNVWWKTWRNGASGGGSKDVSTLTSKGDNTLLIGANDGAGGGLIKELDFDNTGTDGVFRTNYTVFPTDIQITRIDIYHDITDSAGTSAFQVAILNDLDSLSTIKDVTYTNESTKRTRINCDVKVEGRLKLYITPVTDTIGFRHVRIYYASI